MIDWIDVESELQRRTQHWKISERIERLTHRKEYPKARDKGPGNTATRYKLRDVEARRPAGVIDDLTAGYGFAVPALVNGLKVSIDGYPENQSEEAIARLRGALV